MSPTEFRPPPYFRKPVDVGQTQDAGQIRLEMAGMLELTGLSHCNPIFYISQELLQHSRVVVRPSAQMMWGACVPNLHTMSKVLECYHATKCDLDRDEALSLRRKLVLHAETPCCP